MYETYHNESNDVTIQDERRKEHYEMLTQKRIDDLGIYYLYFVCVFLKKAFESFKGMTFNSHQRIEFAEVLPQDFRDACDKVKILPIQEPYKSITRGEISINICERFTAYVNNICFVAKIEEGERFDYGTLRENVFEELKYLCNFYFETIITPQIVDIEPVLDYLVKAINDIKTSHSDNKVDVSTQFSVDLPSLEVTEIANKFPEHKKNNNYKRSNHNQNSTADEELKYNAVVEYSNKVGFRIMNGVLVPYLEELNWLSKTDYSFVLENANLYISWFYQTLQHEYLLNHINEILKIKDTESAKSFCENSSFSSFVPLSDMENLLK